MCGGNSSYNAYSGTTSQKQPPTSEGEAKTAATNLARLMERQLGYAEGHIDPIALRLFIRAYWNRVSTHAHIIHAQED